jgi:hypothetical protein
MSLSADLDWWQVVLLVAVCTVTFRITDAAIDSLLAWWRGE